jgi:hypothetical protein
MRLWLGNRDGRRREESEEGSEGGGEGGEKDKGNREDIKKKNLSHASPLLNSSGQALGGISLGQK